MKTLIAILFLSAFAGIAVADIRNVGGRVVNLDPIYQWEQTNGPATNRTLAAWREIRIVSVGNKVSVYRHCVIAVDGQTKPVLMDHLPAEVINLFANKTRAETRKRELESFIGVEKKRLRLLNAQSIYWDMESRDYANLQVANANLSNREDELDETIDTLKALGTRAATICFDYAVLMNRKYIGLEIWDLGLKR
jgi:hypothetical protein